VSKMSRDKGARFEREVARAFSAAGFDVNRTPNSGGLRLKGDLYGDVPAYVECKHTERWDVPAWIRQMEQECGDEMPMLVMRRNYERAYALLPLTDLLRLMKEPHRLSDEFEEARTQ
jgi:hypothetical protein